MTEENNTPTTEYEAPTTEHDADLSEGFLGESADIPAEEVTEDTPVEEAAKEEVVQEEKAEEPKEKETAPFLTIKYNKEARDLSQDEAIELAQKGMNYDSIYEKYNALKPYEGQFSELNRLAKANGMSVEDYLNNLKEVQDAFELNREVEQLRKEYADADETLITEVAKSRISQRKDSNEAARIRQEDSKKDAIRSEVERQVNKFEQRYPDVDPSKLDKEVYDLMKEDYTLLEAYEIVQGEKRAAEDRIKEKQALSAKQNEENKKKSLGNLTNTGDIEKDAFMEAFLSKD